MCRNTINLTICSDEINFYQETTFNPTEAFPATNPKPKSQKFSVLTR